VQGAPLSGAQMRSIPSFLTDPPNSGMDRFEEYRPRSVHKALHPHYLVEHANGEDHIVMVASKLEGKDDVCILEIDRITSEGAVLPCVHFSIVMKLVPKWLV